MPSTRRRLVSATALLRVLGDCRLIPNCAVKHKRDTKWLVGDQMLPEEVLAPLKPGMPPGTPRHSVRVPKITEYSGLYVRRPHDRVSRGVPWAVRRRAELGASECVRVASGSTLPHH